MMEGGWLDEAQVHCQCSTDGFHFVCLSCHIIMPYHLHAANVCVCSVKVQRLNELLLCVCWLVWLFCIMQPGPIQVPTLSRSSAISVNLHCFYQDHGPTPLSPDPFFDPVGRHGQQFCDMLQHQRVVVNQTDLLGKVFASWHNRNADTSLPVGSGTISSLKRTSRLLHYCSSPILFLPEMPCPSEVHVSGRDSFL